MHPIEAIRQFHDDLTRIRQDIHAHPEMGFEEQRTSALVARLLTSWGIDVHTGIGGTGVVGVLRSGDGRGSVGLRADMDALPMQEVTGQPHQSVHDGKMHACGHDGHTTMLLGAARYLAQSRNFNGVVNFIFQPAEEGLGGASAMLADGLFERFPCDAIFGLHNAPGRSIGQFALCSGEMMAGAAFFDIAISGRGGHAARPEMAVDPVIAACHLGTMLQTIVSRNVKPMKAAVVSVTSIEAGRTHNVIPDKALLWGTIRAFSPETLALLEDRIHTIADHTCAALGASAQVEFRQHFAPLVNDATQAKILADAAAAYVGEDNVERDLEPVMGAEDFSAMLAVRPGAYMYIGNGNSKPLHHQEYDFCDAILPLGAGVLAAVVEAKLPAI